MSRICCFPSCPSRLFERYSQPASTRWTLPLFQYRFRKANIPSNVWVTGSLAKVLQDAGLPGVGKAALVYAFPNEMQSFQIHIQAPSNGIPAYRVTMSDLVNAITGTHISASSTDIVVYVERYMNVTIKTATGVTFLNTTGHIPDILLPAVDPYYHQTTNAFPVAIQPNQNQSVWVDVHVPVTAPPGYYKGTATLRNGATILARMPVIYAVWAWPRARLHAIHRHFADVGRARLWRGVLPMVR